MQNIFFLVDFEPLLTDLCLAASPDYFYINLDDITSATAAAGSGSVSDVLEGRTRRISLESLVFASWNPQPAAGREDIWKCKMMLVVC